MSKASTMLQKSVAVSERAASFLESIKRNIQKNVLDTLIAKRDSVKDKIFELSDFTLATDMNKGQSAISREQAENRFTQIISCEYELELLELELTAKQESFNKYFKDETTA